MEQFVVQGNSRQSRRWFRVEAPVTWRSPHRAGREDFPHPVPQKT